MLADSQDLLVSLTTANGDRLTVQAQVRQRSPRSAGDMAVGVEFINVDEKTVHALIALMFGDADVWNGQAAESGIWKNIWALLSVLGMAFRTSRASQRRDPRAEHSQDCRVIFQDQALEGTVTNVSANGLAVRVSGPGELIGEEGTVHMENFLFKVRRMWSLNKNGMLVAGLQRKDIEQGADQWQKLVSSSGPSSLSSRT